jgi:uncharacterized membrane protein
VSAYDLLKFAHIGGAIVWIGSGICLAVLAAGLRGARDVAGLLALGGQGERLGKLLFTPAAFVTLAAGIGMVAIEPTWSFGDLWILIGFGGIAASGVVQMAVAGPAERRYSTLAADAGIDAPETVAAARRMVTGNVLDIGLLLVVVLAMVAKPTL